MYFVCDLDLAYFSVCFWYYQISLAIFNKSGIFLCSIAGNTDVTFPQLPATSTATCCHWLKIDKSFVLCPSGYGMEKMLQAMKYVSIQWNIF